MSMSCSGSVCGRLAGVRPDIKFRTIVETFRVAEREADWFDWLMSVDLNAALLLTLPRNKPWLTCLRGWSMRLTSLG